jgi:RND family efflux transporter MFP subunit
MVCTLSAAHGDSSKEHAPWTSSSPRPTSSTIGESGITSPATSQDRGDSAVAEFKGVVASARSAEISPRFDGLLEKIHFVAGQPVEKGVLLFEFETTKQELELERDRARLLRAEAQLRVAEFAFKNSQTLRKGNVVSERQFVEAEAARDVAAAAASEARTQVRASEITLKEMKLYAPISGVIGRPSVAQSTYITKAARENSALAVITQLDPIEVIAYVPYNDYAGPRQILSSEAEARERIEFSLTLPNGEKYPHVGKISGGGYEFNHQTQVLEVLVEFPNQKYLLRPGLAVTLQSKIKPDEHAAPLR